MVQRQVGTRAEPRIKFWRAEPRSTCNSVISIQSTAMSSPHRRGPVFSMDTLGRPELLNDLEALQLQGEGIRKAIGFSTTIMKLRKGAHATEVGSDNPTRLDQSADVLVRMKSELTGISPTAGGWVGTFSLDPASTAAIRRFEGAVQEHAKQSGKKLAFVSALSEPMEHNGAAGTAARLDTKARTARRRLCARAPAARRRLCARRLPCSTARRRAAAHRSASTRRRSSTRASPTTRRSSSSAPARRCSTSTPTLRPAPATSPSTCADARPRRARPCPRARAPRPAPDRR